MTKQLAMVVLGGVLGGSVGVADAEGMRAMRLLRDTIDDVDEAGGKCRREMYDDLVDIEKQLLDGQRPSRVVRKLRDLRVHRRCPDRIGRQLGEVRELLEDVVDARRDRRDRQDRDRRDDDRQTSDQPKRPAGVPYSDWSADCLDSWMIIELARNGGSDDSINEMATMFAPACGANGMGQAYYPNGQMAKTSGGTWYYPNGQTAKTSGGTFYYSNGQTAKTSGGTWYYPNGQTAKTSGGTWYYPTGNNAGGWEAVKSQGCAKSRSACAVYNLAINSDIEDWRMQAIVRLGTAIR